MSNTDPADTFRSVVGAVNMISGTAPIPVKLTATAALDGSLERIWRVPVNSPFAAGSKTTFTAHVSAWVAAIVRSASLALEIFTAPRADETISVIANAVLPPTINPFCEITSGWVPMFFKVSVCVAARLPTPSFSAGPNPTKRSSVGATESATRIDARFTPSPESATCTVGEDKLSLWMVSVSLKAPAALGSKISVAIHVSDVDPASCAGPAAKAMAPCVSLTTPCRRKCVPVAKVSPLLATVKGASPVFLNVSVADADSLPVPSACVFGNRMVRSVGNPCESVTTNCIGPVPWPRNDATNEDSSGSSERMRSPSFNSPAASGSKRTRTSHVSVLLAAMVLELVARERLPRVLLVMDSTL